MVGFMEKITFKLVLAPRIFVNMYEMLEGQANSYKRKHIEWELNLRTKVRLLWSDSEFALVFNAKKFEFCYVLC